MRRALALALCVGVLPVSGVASAANQPTKVARGIVASGMPGAVVLVKDREGTRIGAAGFADVGHRRAMRTNSSFRIGSVTKSFVATLVLELAQRGALRLDDSIERWLPGRVPNGGAITLRQLLNHTSGIYSFTSLPGAENNERLDLTHEQVLGLIKDRPLDFEPGTSWRYDNSVFYLPVWL